jgi:carboxyl-terminal processing protease
MKTKRLGTVLGLMAALSACGGDKGGGGSAPVVSTPSPGNPTTAGCTLRARQDWAAGVLNEWYLFPETLPTGLNPAAYGSVDAYIDALTATARSQRRDRYFTYLTSIAEENAYYAQGASAGFGFRLTADAGASRVFVAEAFEDTPALAAGIDRGTEILAIGTSAATLRPVADILAAEGSAGINNALGPADARISRTLRVADAGGTREVTLTKTDYAIAPVSPRYGARIIEDNGRRVGYVNLRTFIAPATPALTQAFAQFRAQGITDYVIDLRYNGGGLVSVAEAFGDLLGADRAPNGVFSYTSFRREKAAENSTRFFQPNGQSVAPVRIAFIGTGSTASASELLINAFIPYLPGRVALIGANTYGKPVGQIAIDRTACDDRLRVVAFQTENSARQGAYFDGLASTVGAACQASDDIMHPLGDPREASTARALDFLAGRSCTPIGAAANARTMAATRRELVVPDRPTTVQREVPGLY